MNKNIDKTIEIIKQALEENNKTTTEEYKRLEKLQAKRSERYWKEASKN